MSEPVYLADSFALREMVNCVDTQYRSDLWGELTTAVEEGRLGFPREVATELKVLARDEQITSWASGLGNNLRQFTADVKYNRPLMGIVSSMGYEEGFDTLDGKEPAVVCVARLAFYYKKLGVAFSVATEDLGEGPLSPTMEQLCIHQEWPYVGASECLKGLGLEHFI